MVFSGNLVRKYPKFHFKSITKFISYMSSSPAIKKVRTMSKIIGTHNGTFHCDEVLACSMLKLLPEYKCAEIVRSRDPIALEKCDIVVDVGGVYDPTKHRYDHHQRSFKETMNSLREDKPWVTKLSSSGLVYFHFGHQIIKEIFGISDVSDPKSEAVYDKVYQNFMEEIDAIDNGISTHDGPPRYIIATNLSKRVGNLNPSWQDAKDEKSVRTRFDKAMQLVTVEFLECVNYYGNVWWPVRDIIKKAIDNRFTIDASGEIIELENGGVPWNLHFHVLEKELKISIPIKYVIFPDTNNTYRIQCVPVEETGFENRLSLPEPWCGLRDEELSKKINLPGAIFVHMNGFIGGHSTRDGALEMARQSLNLKKLCT